MSDHHGEDSTTSSGILLSHPESETFSSHGGADSDVAKSYIHLEGKDLEAVGQSVLGASAVDHEGLNAMRQVQQEEKRLPQHGDIVSQVSGTSTTAPSAAGPAKKSAAAASPSTRAHTAPTATPMSTALITSQEAEQSRFWRVLNPIITRETAVWLAKATAINFILPFINGVFLGFGEICAHELAYRWGWTYSTHVVQAPGRSGQALGTKSGQQDEKNRGGSVSNVGLRNSSGYVYTGSGSGIGGGLDSYEDFE